jgi:spermidine synthase/MFS family permease
MFNKSNFNNTAFIFFFIFCNGLAITAIEMTASRYLAPFFGTSTIVWANIIGVILIALAIGYSIGGKISQLFNDYKVFYLIGLMGGVLALALPIVLGLIFNRFPLFANNIPFWESLGSFMVSLVIFGIPVSFLAMLSPFAVRLISSEVNSVGNKAGNLYAVSTFGSVIGIYLSTFITVPYWGVKNTFFVMALMMMILSIIGLIANDDKKFIAKHQGNVVAFFVLLACLSLLNVTTLNSNANKSLLVDKDGLYQKVKVIQDGKNNYLFFNEGGGIQSAFDSTSPFIGYGNDDEDKVAWYTNHYYFLPALKQFEKKETINVLIVGYSGGAIGRVLKNVEPIVGKKINIDGIEIDPLVNKVSIEHMGVKESDRTIYLEDGRTFLNKNNGSKKYDLIILDAYANSLSISPHLLTTEFFGSVNNNLSPEGLMVFNLNAKDNNSKLFNKTMNSASTAFRNLIYSNTNSLNYFIIGGNNSLISPIEVANQDQDIQKYFVLYQLKQEVFKPNLELGLFTDDLNDSELLTQFERGKWFQ